MDTLTEALRKRATAWSKDIKNRANSAPGKPAHIRVTYRNQVKEGEIDMEFSANSPKGDARAYEKGSGIHSNSPKQSPHQMGSRGFIRIKPKHKKLLAFYWDVLDNPDIAEQLFLHSPKFMGFADDGRGLFRFVDHPGVEAANGGRGYLQPAITAVRRKIRVEIPDEVRKSVVIDIRKVFKQK